MNKITSINGNLIAPLNELNEHMENETAHVTEEERAAWNGHKTDTIIHVTAEERRRWNSPGMYYNEIAITRENGVDGLVVPPEAQSGWYEARVALSFVPAMYQPVSVSTVSGDRDPVYNWDGIMEEKYTPWYNNIPVPNYATRGPSGLELRYDWWDTSPSLSDMACIFYIHHKQGTESFICTISGAPGDAASWGRIIVRQLSRQ